MSLQAKSSYIHYWTPGVVGEEAEDSVQHQALQVCPVAGDGVASLRLPHGDLLFVQTSTAHVIRTPDEKKDLLIFC